MLAWEMLPMSSAKPERLRRFQISARALHAGPERFGGPAESRRGIPRITFVVLVVAVGAAWLLVGPRIIASASRTMQRIGNSAEILGQTGADLLPQTIEAFRLRN